MATATKAKMATAYTVSRGGKVIGAIFPDRFTLRIVRVPFHDPDRDGMVNGRIHAIRLEPAGFAANAITDSLPTPFDGLQGSAVFLGCQLAGAVDAWNKAATLA